MTDIRFDPYTTSASVSSYYFGVEAHWLTQKARRKVFAHWQFSRTDFGEVPMKGKSPCRIIGCAYYPDARRKAKHLADVLNLWITEHNEEELNTLLRLIQKRTTANLTDAENKLLADYLLNGGEPF